MSGAHRRRAGGERIAAGAVPGRTMVAVLERRGRFLTAEPLFPRRESPGARQHTRGPGRIVVHAAASRGGARVRAGAGDLVLVDLGRRGSGATVARLIGRPDVARDLIEALMLDRGLPRGFAPALEREAELAGAGLGEERERRDLRELPTFTVDPASARDFDDAISAQATAQGQTRVWVHIADVAAHVAEGSALDREARRRATSVYVPGAVEPMLPHALSSNACSLLPGRERVAVTVELELDGATVVRSAFYRSLIRSDARLDYEHVDRIFAGGESAPEPWGESLLAARGAAAALQEKRERSGALVLESEEPEFTFDEHGNVTGVRPQVQTESHRLIEHLMIAANEAVAGLLAGRGVPCLYRVHERPDPERVERLADQLGSLQVPTPPLPEGMSSTQAAELLGQISRMVESHVRRTGRGRIALGSLVLRSLKQAYYSPRNLGHAGLHSVSYCHFTSPIRRYPDLVCHRALLSTLGGAERAPQSGELAELGAWTSEREREAMLIERDADDIAGCLALSRSLYEGDPERVFQGEVAGLIPAGVFVAFGDAREDERGEEPVPPPFEGMLPVRLLGSAPPRESGGRGAGRAGGAGRGGRAGSAHRGRDGGEGEREWWELNEEGTILQGQRSGSTLRLGDPIAVRVGRVDAVRGRVDLQPAG